MTRALPSLLIAFVFLLAGLVLAFVVGRYPVSLGDVIHVVAAKLAGRSADSVALIAVSKTGQRAVAGSWLVPATGYGVPGHPAHLVIAGATVVKSQSLSSVEIDVVGGSALLRIPV